MNIPDYYDWRAAEQYYNDHEFTYSTNDYICELPEWAQAILYEEVGRVLCGEGYDVESEEFEAAMEDIMSNRLWVLEDYIDLEKVLGEE